jgi:hypothetical protein
MSGRKAALAAIYSRSGRIYSGVGGPWKRGAPPLPRYRSGIRRVRWGSVWQRKGTGMAHLEDLIRRINRDMEEHRRQVEHCRQVDMSRRAMAEQCKVIAEQVGWVQRYCWLPLAFAVVTVIGVLWGPSRSS